MSYSGRRKKISEGENNVVFEPTAYTDPWDTGKLEEEKSPTCPHQASTGRISWGLILAEATFSLLISVHKLMTNPAIVAKPEHLNADPGSTLHFIDIGTYALFPKQPLHCQSHM